MNKSTLVTVIGIIIVIVAITIGFTLYQEEELADNSAQNSPSLLSIETTLPSPDVAQESTSEITPENTAQTTPDQKPENDNEPVIIPPTFDIVSITPEGDSVIAGRAEPGSVITITNENKEIGKATVNNQGEWVYIPDLPLSPGTKRLGLEMNREDKETVVSENEVVIVVPKANKDIAGIISSQPTGALALKVPRDSNTFEGAIILQNPSKKSSSDLSVDIVDYNNKGNLSVSGQAKPNASVNLYLDNLFIGQAKTDENNSWQIVPDFPIEPGIYKLRADEVDKTGKVISRVAIPFSQADTEMVLPEGKFIVVQPGNSLWRLARRTYGSGFSYSIIYQANKDTIKDPDLIYAGQIFALPNKN